VKLNRIYKYKFFICVLLILGICGCAKVKDESKKEIPPRALKNFESEFVPAKDSAMAKGIHPRIWIEQEDLKKLRNECLGGVKSPQWERFKRYVDRFSARGNIAIKGSAFCYLILKDSDKDAASAYAKKAIGSMLNHPEYGNKSYLMRSAVLEAFSLGYDWCYDVMTEKQRSEITDMISSLAKTLNSSGKANISTLHNYVLTSIAPVGLASIAIYGDHPEGKDIYNSVVKKYADVLNIYEYLKDGGWYEGTDYNRLSTWPSIRFFAALATSADINLFETSPFLKNHLYYLIYTLRPDRTFYRGYDVLYPMITDAHRKMLVLLTTHCRNGHAQWLYENTFADEGLDYPYMHSRNLLAHLIWYDPDIRPITPSDKDSPLSLSRYFSGLGLVVMRSDWSDNALWISFQNHDWLSSHHHADNNAFTILKKGALAIDAGGLAMMRVGNKHYNAYHSRTVAHNTLLIMDSKEQWPGGLNIANDGGQRIPRLHVFKNFSEWLSAYDDTNYAGGKKYSSINLAGDIHYENYDKHYTYLSSDATKSYSSHKINYFVREFVYFQPNYIVIFDRVSSKNKKFEKSWLLHSIDKPRFFKSKNKEILMIANGINSFDNIDMARIDHFDGGRLFCKMLLPEKNSVKIIGGSGYEFFVDGKNWTSDKEFMAGVEGGAWRFEVKPAHARKEDLFLNVLYPTDNSIESIPKTETIYSKDNYMVGTQIENYLVLFSKSGKDIERVNYSIEYNGIVRHLVCNLEPNKKFRISANGKFLKEMSSSKEGTLYFATKGQGKQKVAIN